MKRAVRWAGISLAMVGLAAAAPPRDARSANRAGGRAERWLAPQAPVRVFGNSYLVGFADLNVVLIRSNAGLILVDAGVPQGAQKVVANMRRLGFSIRDVKFILSTEPHQDHAGALALLARESGATVVASAAAAPVLASGGQDPTDPQAPMLQRFPPYATCA